MLEEIAMAIRAALASLLAAAVSVQLGFNPPAYSVIAAVVVTDLIPEHTRRLSIQRLSGILIGTVIGVLFDRLATGNLIVMALAVGSAMSLCAFLKLGSGARLAGYLAGIMVLIPRATMISYSVNQFLETCLGVCFAVLVSYIPRRFLTGQKS